MLADEFQHEATPIKRYIKDDFTMRLKYLLKILPPKQDIELRDMIELRKIINEYHQSTQSVEQENSDELPSDIFSI